MDNAGTSLPPTLGEVVRGDAAATRKGTRRAAQILQAALDAIVETGYNDLTLEAVARRVGISKGNLQYYFPTRSDLLKAAFAEHLAAHKRTWLEVHDAAAPDARTRLRRLIAFELAANRDPRFVTQVRERWSLAARDRELRRLSNNSHRWVTGRYAALIAALRPDLDKRACRQLGMVIYAMLIGSAPYFGPERAIPSMSGGLDKRIEDAIFDMIEAAA